MQYLTRNITWKDPLNNVFARCSFDVDGWGGYHRLSKIAVSQKRQCFLDIAIEILVASLILPCCWPRCLVEGAKDERVGNQISNYFPGSGCFHYIFNDTLHQVAYRRQCSFFQSQHFWAVQVFTNDFSLDNPWNNPSFLVVCDRLSFNVLHVFPVEGKTRREQGKYAAISLSLQPSLSDILGLYPF